MAVSFHLIDLSHAAEEISIRNIHQFAWILLVIFIMELPFKLKRVYLFILLLRRIQLFIETYWFSSETPEPSYHLEPSLNWSIGRISSLTWSLPVGNWMNYLQSLMMTWKMHLILTLFTMRTWLGMLFHLLSKYTGSYGNL